MPVVICGGGRIGGALSRLMSEQEISWQAGRIDPQTGMSVAEEPLPEVIQLLIICIAPGRPAKWSWASIFNGLVKQVLSGKLKIEQCVFVSSTRVYEGYSQGLITAANKPLPTSLAAEQIVVAEQSLGHIANDILILRATGLYGDDYLRYIPIMKSAPDKPRFGLQQAALVQRLVDVILASIAGSFTAGVELMTDGNLYFKGDCLQADVNAKRVLELSQEFRLLINSYFT